MEIKDELIDELIKGYQSPEEILGENGLLKQLSLKYVSWKRRKEVAADLKMIYTASTVEQAATNLEEFSRNWDKEYPTISGSWRNNWQRIIPLFGYPPEIRKVIYTTNAIESLNMSLRKVTKNRGSFPNSVKKVMSKPIKKLPLTLITNVPRGRLLPHLWPIQRPMEYLAIAPRKPPMPIIR